MILVALGIDAQGNNQVLGLHKGSSEAARVVRSGVVFVVAVWLAVLWALWIWLA